MAKKYIYGLLSFLICMNALSGSNMQAFHFDEKMISYPSTFFYNKDGQVAPLLVPAILYGTQEVKGVDAETLAAIRSSFAENDNAHTKELLIPLIAENNAQALMALPFVFELSEKEEAKRVQQACYDCANEENDPIALFNAGILCYLADDSNAATSYFERASAFPFIRGLSHYMLAFTDNADDVRFKHHLAIAGYEEHMPEALHWLGSCARHNEPKEKFLEDKKHLVALIEKESEFKDRSCFAEALNRLGWIYAFKNDNLEQAFPLLHQAADIYKNPAAHYNLGCVYSDLNNFDKAIEYYKRSIKRYQETATPIPNSPYSSRCQDMIVMAQNNLSLIYEHEKCHEKATQYAFKVACTDYNQPTSTIHYWGLENDAAKRFENMKLLAKKHDDSMAKIMLSYHYAVNKPEKALTLLDAVIEKEHPVKTPDDRLFTHQSMILAMAAKGLVLYAHNDIEKAVETLEPIADWNPGAVSILLNHYAKNNDLERAKYYQDKLLCEQLTDYLSFSIIQATKPSDVIPPLDYIAHMPNMAHYFYAKINTKNSFNFPTQFVEILDKEGAILSRTGVFFQPNK